jgi:branched-chain amino acid transport system ATP-binding protein
LLEVTGLTKHFGGLVALYHLDLSVNEGEIMGLIGPNGAGKTTAFNVIAGIYQPTEGRVVFQGEDITGHRPDKIARKGLVRTFQMINLWQGFTVMESMRVAFQMEAGISFVGGVFNTASTRQKEQDIDERAMEVLRSVGMDHLKDQGAETCSHGYQRTLSLAIAFASKPRLLLLDEPVTALNPERVATMLGLIRKIREEGTTVLIIEHNMRVIFNICDRIAVLNYGTKLAEGTPSEIRENKEVIEAYLGAKKGVS